MEKTLNKKELQELFLSTVKPLEPFFTGRGRLKFGTHGTVYSESAREVEAFLRPLWGFGPFLTSGNDEGLLDKYIEEIAAATDPEGEFYWGDVTDYDQLIVEMASLSTTFLLNKEKVWGRFTEKEQINIHKWLISVNEKDIPKNNWYFFRILVNLAMKECGMSFSQEQIDSDFELMNSFYNGNGWYFDGEETQHDYYVSFAIHFYSLVYARFIEEENPERASLIKERATIFAQSFKHWFDADGEALPFGRSLTYRFAQVSFFSALVFANVEALPWGEIKGLINRHMNNWMSKEIFNTNHLLTVGYHYENLVFAEGYNGFGSPYWALKTFILLAVPDEHPYWEAKELPLSIEERFLSVPESKNFYQYNKSLTHLQAFPAGQYVRNQNYPQAKYSKFVYSTKFGFSVPKSDYRYYEGAYDSTLAISTDEDFFRPKNKDVSFEVLSDRVIHVWNPFKTVEVKSTIVPLENCHVRIHEIKTNESLNIRDGAFSVPYEGSVPVAGSINSAEAVSVVGTSRIDNIKGFEKAGIERLEPNTNIFFQRTVLPFLQASIDSGNHVFVSVVYGLVPEDELLEPEVTVNESNVVIVQGSKEITINIS